MQNLCRLLPPVVSMWHEFDLLTISGLVCHTMYLFEPLIHYRVPKLVDTMEYVCSTDLLIIVWMLTCNCTDIYI